MMRSMITAFIFTTGCIQIGGTLEDVCIHKSGIMIEGMPADVPTDLLPSIEHGFVHDDLDALAPLLDSGLDTEVYFTAATLRAPDQDLRFVQRVALIGRSANTNVDLPAIDLASCTGDCVEENEVSLAASEDLSVMEYLTSGAIEFRMTVAGDLPKQDWTLDVDVCLRGEVSHRISL